MWSEARLSWPSKLLVVGILLGFVMLAAGFVAYNYANRPVPPGAPYDPNRYYERDLLESHGVLAAGLGGILLVAAMVFLGVLTRELNPQVRRALLVGGGVILIGIALLLVQPFSGHWIW